LEDLDLAEFIGTFLYHVKDLEELVEVMNELSFISFVRLFDIPAGVAIKVYNLRENKPTIEID